MASPTDPEQDELAGTEQPFVTHLVEVRDRLIRALVAVVVVFGVLCLWPGPGTLYDLLSAPLVATLPAGATMIATNVISPFVVPLKITLMAAFMIALPERMPAKFSTTRKTGSTNATPITIIILKTKS